MTTDQLIGYIESNSERYAIDYAGAARRTLRIARLNVLTAELNMLTDMLIVKGLPNDTRKLINRKIKVLEKSIAKVEES